MTMNFYPSFMPIGIGSLPYHDPYQASQTVLDHFPESPYWPQLPSRDFKEGMLAQFTEGMPGVSMDGERVYFHSPFNPPSEWEKFYEVYSEGHLDNFTVGKEYASGFYTFLELIKARKPLLIKGQITGPLTLALSVTDEQGKSIFFNDTLADVIQKGIVMKARWQISYLKQLCNHVIIFVDEPILAASPNSMAILLIVSAGTMVIGETISGVYCFRFSLNNCKAGRHIIPSTV
jgi:hypothetical protein